MFDRSEYIKAPLANQKEILTLFDRNENLTIFDIGGCEGEDSVKYSRLFKNSKVYTFEPLPSNTALIKANLLKYKVENVSLIEKALSSEVGTAEFFVSEGNPEGIDKVDWDYGNKSSSLLAPERHTELVDFIRFDKKITVETTTLELFCTTNNINLVHLIHMDVQGAELMVLQGAKSFLNNIKAIWLEVSKIHLYSNQPLAKDVSKFMEDNGFTLVYVKMKGLQGDHLYVSNQHFQNTKEIRKQIRKINPTFFGRALRRLKSLIE